MPATRTCTTLAACALLSLAAGTAAAATSVHGDFSGFITATGATSATGALPAPTSTSGSRSFGSATFTAPNWQTLDWSTLLPGNEIGVSNGAGDTSVPTPYYNDGIDVSFSTPVHAAGFWFHQPTATGTIDGCNVSPCVDSQFVVVLQSGGSTVASIPWTPLKDQAEFWGVASSQAFDTLRIRETVGTDDNEFYGQFYSAVLAPVPEPGTWAMLGAGLCLLSRRLRRP